MTIVIVLFVGAMATLVLLAIRNEMVYSYRQRLLTRVSQQTKRELWGNWERWYDAWDEVGYDQMVIQFWRRLPSFYEDTLLSELTTRKWR